MDIQIQRYKNAKDNKGELYTVQEAIKAITGKMLKDTTTEYRNAPPGELKDVFKKTQFPAVTWSGTFTKRKASELVQHSGLICIDIDKLTAEQLEGYNKLLRHDVHVYFMFISPSNAGLKIIFKIPNDATTHKQAFLAISNYLQQEYSMLTDDSGKDVSRLCFLCHDVTAFYNEAAVPFPVEKYTPAEPVKPKVPAKPYTEFKAPTSYYDSLNKSFEFILAWVNKNETYENGIINNNYIYLFACGCNRCGISISDCESYVSSNFHEGNDAGILASIKSAYSNNAGEFGKFAYQPKTRTNDKATKSPKANAVSNSGHANGNNEPTDTNKVQGGTSDSNGSNDKGGRFFLSQETLATSNEQPATSPNPIQFWREDTNEKTGKKQIAITYNGLIDFLEHDGYQRFALADDTDRLVRLQDNILNPVNKKQVQNHVVDYLKTEGYLDVLEVIRRGSDRYFKDGVLDSIHQKHINTKRDTKHEAFFFHSNCIVRVTADKIEKLAYTELDRAIWKKRIIKRPFDHRQVNKPLTQHGYFNLDGFNCEMAHYNAVTSHNPSESKSSEIVANRWLAHCTSIGYMLHGFKNPATAKTILAVDHEVPENKADANGGTGKSIVGHGFTFIKQAEEIDGKQFDEKNKFNLDQVDIDSQIIVMADCKHNLDFSFFFNAITGNFQFRKLYGGTIVIPFADSPKWWFDTNYIFKGNGNSFERRQHIIEFSDFFKKGHTPYDYFGHSIYDDWSEEEWLLFYNHYYHCVQLYLLMGLVPYPDSNYQERRLKVEIPAELIDLLDAKALIENQQTKELTELQWHKIERNKEMWKETIFDEWVKVAIAGKLNPGTTRVFGDWVKKYCSQRGLNLLVRKSGGREHWTICDENFKAAGK